MATKIVTRNYTEALRSMKPGEVIELPAKALAGLKATILTRLRNELIMERADWEIGKISEDTGRFRVKRITKPRHGNIISA